MEPEDILMFLGASVVLSWTFYFLLELSVRSLPILILFLIVFGYIVTSQDIQSHPEENSKNQKHLEDIEGSLTKGSSDEEDNYKEEPLQKKSRSNNRRSPKKRKWFGLEYIIFYTDNRPIF